MAITSDTEICNMTLSHLGSFGTANNIQVPVSQHEVHFARWYDVTRQSALRLAIPNFAKRRRLVAQKATAPVAGYSFAHEYPSDCLRVLGFGDIDEKDLRYNIEADANGDVEIQLDTDYSTGGMPLRFIHNTTDVNKFTADFKILFSWMLAENVALPITQNLSIKKAIMEILPGKISEFSGVNAQENPPTRKSTSKFKSARSFNVIRNNEKR
ncbi:MAG: hypothetical protein V3U75_13350 [Methylococcaceae bacterium]